MRKSLLLALILVPVLLFWACDPPDDFTVKSSFKDATTFVIVALGHPKVGITDKLQREYTAERAALLVAQNEMVVKLKRYRIVSEEITNTQYDKDQNCILTYIVKVAP